MKFAFRAALSLCLLAWTAPAFAQSTVRPAPRVVTSCGTPPYTYRAGNNEPALQDVNGNACTAASVSASIAGFNPTAGATATLSASGTSADAALPAGTDIVVTSPSTNTVPVFIRLQAGAGTAVTTDMPIVPGAAVGFHVLTATHISGITAGTAATLQIQGGSGLATGYGGGGSGGGGGAVTMASGAVASGAYASGSIASGALAAGSGTDGWDATQGTKSDAPCASGSTTPCSTEARLAHIENLAAAAIPAGGNIIGKVGIDQTTPGTTNAVSATNFPSSVSTGTGAQGASSPRVTVATDSATVAGSASLPTGSNVVGKVGIDQTTPGTTNAVQLIPGTTGGLTWTTIEPAASDNHTNLKNGAGQIYEITAFNNSATINYLRLYNAGTGFNGCNSATNLVAVFHIPANTSDAGFLYKSDVGIPFSTGISYCVVSAYGQATTTNATASAIDINIGSK